MSPEEEDFIHLEDIYELSDRIFRYLISKCFANFCTYLSSFILCLFGIRIVFAISALLFVDIIFFIMLTIIQNKAKRFLISFILTEIFFEIIFSIGFVVCYFNEFPWIITYTLSIIHLILNFLSCREGRKSIFFQPLAALNINFYLTSFFVCCRLQRYIEWNISICFIPTFLFIIFSIILYLKDYHQNWRFLNCNKSLNNYLKDNIKIISIMLFLLCFGGSLSFLSIINLEKQDSNFYKNLSFCCLICLMYFFFQIILVFITASKVRKYIEEYFIFNYEIENSQNNVSRHPDPNILSTERIGLDNNLRNISSSSDLIRTKTEEILKNYVKFCIPKRLVMKSSGYYVVEKEEKGESISENIVINVRKRGNSQIPHKTKNGKDENKKDLTLIKRRKILDSSRKSTYFNKIENRPLELSIEGKSKCLLCCDNFSNAVIMECGHAGMCYECSIKIWKNNEDCHICRHKILFILQVIPDENSKGFFIIQKFLFLPTKDKLTILQENYNQRYEEIKSLNKLHNFENDPIIKIEIINNFD